MPGPTWDSTFRSALASRELTGLRVAVVLGPAYTPATGGPAAGAEIVFRNFGTDTATQFNCLGSRCKVAGASLDAVGWTTTADQLTFDVVGDAAIRAAIDAGVTRGTFVEVRVTLEGDSPTNEYYRVWIGRLQQIQSAGQYGALSMFTLTAYGAQSLLAHRRIQTGTDAGTVVAILGGSQLFWELSERQAPVESYVAAPVGGYTVGDTNVQVADSTGFQFETSGTGVIRLTNGTDTFYLTYTGISSNTFTGVSATGQFGTTAVNLPAATSSVVSHVAYLTGHPLDVLRRIMQSTGAGTNGTWDDYPAQWGLAVPAGVVDNQDIEDWKTDAFTETLTVHILMEDSPINAFSWLSDWLSRLGIAVVMYEGRLSVRCAQDHTDASPMPVGFNIVDGATVKLAWSYCDPRNTYEYAQLIADTQEEPDYNPLTVEKTSILFSAPGGGYLPVPLWDVSHPWSPGFDLQMEDDVERRRYHWACGIAERISVTIAHRGPAVLCPGDLTTLTTALAFGKPEAASATNTYSGVQVLVVAGPDMDWLNGQTTDITVLRYRDESPPDE